MTSTSTNLDRQPTNYRPISTQQFSKCPFPKKKSSTEGHERKKYRLWRMSTEFDYFCEICGKSNERKNNNQQIIFLCSWWLRKQTFRYVNINLHNFFVLAPVPPHSLICSKRILCTAVRKTMKKAENYFYDDYYELMPFQHKNPESLSKT